MHCHLYNASAPKVTTTVFGNVILFWTAAFCLLAVPLLGRSGHQDAVSICFCYLVFWKPVQLGIWADVTAQDIMVLSSAQEKSGMEAQWKGIMH